MLSGRQTGSPRAGHPTSGMTPNSPCPEQIHSPAHREGNWTPTPAQLQPLKVNTGTHPAVLVSTQKYGRKEKGRGLQAASTLGSRKD